jgi:nucleoside-diphosphate-sugar epimerase
VTVALVTGGSGYFGALLLEQLADDGQRLRNFDVNPPESSGGEFIKGDIRDYAAIRAACDGVDVVYHNVAQVPLARDRELFHSVNVTGAANLLRAAADAGVGKVVVTSSSAVFGVHAVNPVTEESPLAPAEAYGQAKAEAEALCHRAVAAGLDVTIIRPRTIHGHGRLGIFGILFDWVADGADIFVIGSGDNRYQFVHADDLARACRLAGARSGPAVYNIGAAEFGSMRESLEALVAHAGTGSRVRSLPLRPARVAMAAAGRLGLAPFASYHWLGYSMSLWFDITRARQELGWEPTYSNAAMFCDSYDWFLKHRADMGAENRSSHRSPAKQGALRLLKGVARLPRVFDGRRR